MRLGVKPISLVIFGVNEPAVLNRKVSSPVWRAYRIACELAWKISGQRHGEDFRSFRVEVGVQPRIRRVYRRDKQMICPNGLRRIPALHNQKLKHVTVINCK